MAVIFGGLSGSGLLAAKEFAAQGAPYVVTTSKSGRTDQREEMEKLLAAVRRNTPHYNVRCDTSDGAAVADVMAELGKPVPFQESAFEAKIIEFCQMIANELWQKPPEQCDQKALVEVLDQLRGSQAKLEQGVSDLSQRQQQSYSQRNHMALLKAEDELGTVRETIELLESKLTGQSK